MHVQAPCSRSKFSPCLASHASNANVTLLVPLPAAVCAAPNQQDLDFSTVLAPKAEALFDELSDVLAPYYMGANSPLPADDLQVSTRQTAACL